MIGRFDHVVDIGTPMTGEEMFGMPGSFSSSCAPCVLLVDLFAQRKEKESNKEADHGERTGLTGEGKEDEEADVEEARGGEHRKEGQGNKRDLPVQGSSEQG